MNDTGRRSLWVVLLLGAVLYRAPLTSAAPPQLDRCFPAGGTRGTSTEVTAEGKFDPWPPQVWCSTPDLQVEFAEKKGQLTVHADAETPCGVHWLRFYNQEGASALRPFVIGGISERLEKEPNNELTAAQAVELPTIVNGRLEKSGDVDTYSMELESGQQLVAALDAHQKFGAPLDAVLQIVDEKGFVVAQNDDSRRLDPLLIFTAPKSGTYRARTFGFPSTPNQRISFAGGKELVYRLTLTTQGFMDHTLPLAVQSGQSTDVELFGWSLPEGAGRLSVHAGAEFTHVFHPKLAAATVLPTVTCESLVIGEGCSPDNPELITLPTVASGRITAADQAHSLDFEGKAEQTIEVRIEADGLGSLLDPHLELQNAAGKVLAEADDRGRQDRDCQLSHKLPADGTYRIVVRDAFRKGGQRHYYRLTVRRATAGYSLSTTNDSFVVTKEKPVEIPITVARVHGFNQVIDVQAIDLPTGVQCEVVKSEAKGDSSKKVTLKLTSTGGSFSGPIRIRGQVAEGQLTDQYASYSVAAPQRSFGHIWLTAK